MFYVNDYLCIVMTEKVSQTKNIDGTVIVTVQDNERTIFEDNHSFMISQVIMERKCFKLPFF